MSRTADLLPFGLVMLSVKEPDDVNLEFAAPRPERGAPVSACRVRHPDLQVPLKRGALPDRVRSQEETA